MKEREGGREGGRETERRGGGSRLKKRHRERRAGQKEKDTERKRERDWRRKERERGGREERERERERERAREREEDWSDLSRVNAKGLKLEDPWTFLPRKAFLLLHSNIQHHINYVSLQTYILTIFMNSSDKCL